MQREMINMSQDQAQKNGWDIVKPFECEVIGKAVYEGKADGIRIMKSTKRFKVAGGWIYNTSTEIYRGNLASVAEALCFVPNTEE